MPHPPRNTPDDLFQRYLTAYRMHLQRVVQVRKLKGIELQWSLRELQQAQRNFETQITELHRHVDFTLPMQLALFWVRMQTFWILQWPLIGRGWRQASQSFQGLYDPDNDPS
jgi:hypothetical protein